MGLDASLFAGCSAGVEDFWEMVSGEVEVVLPCHMLLIILHLILRMPCTV